MQSKRWFQIIKHNFSTLTIHIFDNEYNLLWNLHRNNELGGAVQILINGNKELRGQAGIKKDHRWYLALVRSNIFRDTSTPRYTTNQGINISVLEPEPRHTNRSFISSSKGYRYCSTPTSNQAGNAHRWYHFTQPPPVQQIPNNTL